MISVVLMEIATPGNLGAVARVMKNFDLSDLVLINPKCNHLDIDAISRAKHAKDILKKAKVKSFSYLKQFDYLIATTALIGTDYNIPRSPMTPEQLAEKLPRKGKIAVIFGREASGLTNKEILMCDFVVAVPTSKKYPTLNIGHAASIIFYELFKKNGKNKLNGHIALAAKKEKGIILKLIDDVLNNIKFQTKEKKETQKILWKRMIGKSFLTKREAFALMGFFRKIKK
jgi:TrmH family RNA methyltransferase